MRYMLDTNTLIYFIKRQPLAVAERINALPGTDTLCMSFVTWAELLLGAERSQHKAANLRRLDLLATYIEVLFPKAGQQAGICERYAQCAADLRRRGQPIGGNDLWIAAHALAEDATLVTHNTREFERVTGLRVEDWVSTD
jgi:tRNA(fMet)-specific endonuclease VapC